MTPRSNSFNAEEILEGICAWVRIESPTTHVEGVNRMMDVAEGAMRELGARSSACPERRFADVVRARNGAGGRDLASSSSAISTRCTASAHRGAG